MDMDVLRRRLSSEEVNALPLCHFEGHVHVVRSEEDWQCALPHLREESVLGFDTETRPSFRKGRRNAPALIQLATAQAVYLIQLAWMPFGPDLAALLANPAQVKAGVGIRDDMRDLAATDPLTGVANRRQLVLCGEEELARNRRYNGRMSLVMVDIDRFKAINDRWGHEAGDRVLLEISQRLKQALRGNDTIARIGGDEFTLLLLGLDSQEECEEILRRLLGNIEQPLSCLPEPESVSASIGVTLFPLDDEEPDTLLRHADQAMYQAKQAGKRTLSLKADDLEHYKGERGRRGNKLPRGFQRVDQLLVEVPGA